MEKSMLRAFGFVTHVEHPHKFVLSLLQILGLDERTLHQEAWNLTNDRCAPVMHCNNVSRFMLHRQLQCINGWQAAMLHMWIMGSA